MKLQYVSNYTFLLHMHTSSKDLAGTLKNAIQSSRFAQRNRLQYVHAY